MIAVLTPPVTVSELIIGLVRVRIPVTVVVVVAVTFITSIEDRKVVLVVSYAVYVEVSME